MQRWQCRIHNGTLLCLIKCELDNDINVYIFENWLFSNVVYIQKRLVHFFYTKTYNSYQNKTLFYLEKRQYFPNHWSNNGFKGTFVNRVFSSLHRGSLKLGLQYFSTTFDTHFSLGLKFSVYFYWSVINICGRMILNEYLVEGVEVDWSIF